MGSSGLQRQVTLTKVADPKKHPPRGTSNTIRRVSKYEKRADV